MRTLHRLSLPALAVAGVCTIVFAQQPQAPAPGQPAPAPPIAGGPVTPSNPGQTTNLGTDPNGNPLRLALKTGHVSNYDETKVAAYTLPDPLVASGGAAVRDAKGWPARRKEILEAYERDIYGRVPAKTPRVAWQIVET